MASEPTPAQLVDSAVRELNMRKRVYPYRVSQGKMTQAAMDHELACQQAILQIVRDHAQGRLL